MIPSQKEGEKKVQEILEESIEEAVSVEFLKEACCFITQIDYENIVEERSINKICGYMLCANPLTKVYKQANVIRRKQVYDISKRKMYCSDACFKSSEHLVAQLPEVPTWLRVAEDEVKELSLLSHQVDRFCPGTPILTDYFARPDNTKPQDTELLTDIAKLVIDLQSASLGETPSAKNLQKPVMSAKAEETLEKMVETFQNSNILKPLQEQNVLVEPSAQANTSSGSTQATESSEAAPEKTPGQLEVKDDHKESAKCKGTSSAHEKTALTESDPTLESNEESSSKPRPLLNSSESSSEKTTQPGQALEREMNVGTTIVVEKLSETAPEKMSSTTTVQFPERQHQNDPANSTKPISNSSEIENKPSSNPPNSHPKPPIQQTLFQAAEARLKEWFTLRTLKYVLGNEKFEETCKTYKISSEQLYPPSHQDPDKIVGLRKSFQSLCRILDERELQELEEDEKILKQAATTASGSGESPQKSPQPAATKKKKKVKIVDVEKTTETNNEGEETEYSMVLPYIDHFHQKEIRANQIYHEIQNTIGNFFSTVLYNYNSDLTQLIKTFHTTSENLYCDKLAWVLICICLFKLVSLHHPGESIESPSLVSKQEKMAARLGTSLPQLYAMLDSVLTSLLTPRVPLPS